MSTRGERCAQPRFHSYEGRDDLTDTDDWSATAAHRSRRTRQPGGHLAEPKSSDYPALIYPMKKPNATPTAAATTSATMTRRTSPSIAVGSLSRLPDGRLPAKITSRRMRSRVGRQGPVQSATALLGMRLVRPGQISR